MKLSYRWPFKVLFLSISLSIIFSLLSQSLQPYLSIYFSIFIIAFFIFTSVIFDMIGIAFASLKKADLERFKDSRGYIVAKRLCDNCEKVSSFGGDVVGDICSILSGAGGLSLVLNMHIENSNIFLLASCLISSLIAGLTIFFKALMKNYAITNCTKIAMIVGKMLDFNFKRRKARKNTK